MKPIAFLFPVVLVLATAPQSHSQSMSSATQAWGPGDPPPRKTDLEPHTKFLAPPI